MGALRVEDGAASAILGFLAAMVAYGFALVVFLGYASTPPTESSTVDVDLQDRATTALGVMVTDSTSWPADADGLTRFGLVGDEGSNFLSFDKIESLARGQMAATDNGYVDYQEARAALGLTDHQFHLRTYPALVALDDAAWSKMRGIRVGYLADFSEPSSSASLAASVATVGSAKEYRLAITNTGVDPMIFVTTFEFEVDDRVQTTTRQTKLLSNGQTDTLAVKIHPMKAWEDSSIAMDLTTSDNYDNCAGCDDKALSASTTTSGAYEIHYLAETDDSYYGLGETVSIDLGMFDKTGRDKMNQEVRVKVYRPLASDPNNQQEASPMYDNSDSDFDRKETRSCACADRVGVWKVVVTPISDAARDTTFYYYVAASTLFTASTTMDPVAAQEVEYLNDLVEDFDSWTYSPGNGTGDVYEDNHQEMDPVEAAVDNSPPTCDGTPEYDLFVVGSNVAHNALVKIKDEIADFVDCGGTLIAFGTDRSGTQWLQSVYHVALQDGAGGGIGNPDATHPLLTVPERLAWSGYDDTGYVWDIGPGNDIYSHAVDGADSSELILGVSDQGALNGTVVLTSWTPGALTTPQNDDEAKRLLHNLLSQGYRMLFLDYGPPIPDGVPVGSSSRLAAIAYDDLVQSPYVETRVVLYVWRG